MSVPGPQRAVVDEPVVKAQRFVSHPGRVELTCEINGTLWSAWYDDEPDDDLDMVLERLRIEVANLVETLIGEGVIER